MFATPYARIVMGLWVSAAWGGFSRAAEAKPAVRLAVLACRAISVETDELSRTVPALLTGALSKREGLELVEREDLDKALKEQALGATGLVDAEQAAKLGKLLGTRIVVTASAFVADRELFLAAHVINVETGRVKAATRSTPLGRPAVASLCEALADDIARILKSDLVNEAKSDNDTFKALIEKLKANIGNGARPTLTLVLPEEHMRRPVPDPAAATELAYVLRKLRFTVIENDNADLELWVKNHFAGKATKFPAAIGDVDVVIYGGGISEDAGRAGALFSARARVELTAMNVKTGEVVAVNRATAAAADVAQNIAAKAALQKATLAVADEFIAELVAGWRKR
jgi:hypothetical protein